MKKRSHLVSETAVLAAQDLVSVSGAAGGRGGKSLKPPAPEGKENFSVYKTPEGGSFHIHENSNYLAGTMQGKDGVKTKLDSFETANTHLTATEQGWPLMKDKINPAEPDFKTFGE